MQTLHRAILLLLLAALPSVVLALDGPTAARIRQNGVIVLAYRQDAAPFAYADVNHQPVGYSIDLCNRVVAELRRELGLPNLRARYLPVTLPERLTAIETGKADIECGSTTNTVERRRRVGFAMTHFYAAAKLLVRKDAYTRIAGDVLGTPGRRIAAERGSLYAARLADQIVAGTVRGTLVEVASTHDGVDMLIGGRVDACLDVDFSLYLSRASLADPAAVEILPDALAVEPEGLMLPRGDTAFKHFVDTTLGRLMLDGDAVAMYRRWFQSPIAWHGVVNLQMPLGQLLSDQFAFPSDRLGDGTDS
jgi:ABC-type amino acid transport substrate-binding protein